jgi:acyl-CoA synthetase (AMP-forming)/AMP-acid ligase II
MTQPVFVSMGEWLPLTAQRQPTDVCFLRSDGSSVSFGELNERVNRLASALSENGVGRGDRIAILALDSTRYAETVLAALKIGAVFMPINWRLRAEEVATLFARGKPAAVFHGDQYADTVLATEFDVRLRVNFDAPGTDSSSYESFLATGAPVEPPNDVPDDELFGLAFTSGTTGLPKGVLQSRRMMKNMVMSGLAEFPMGPGDLRYSASPMFHVTGINMVLIGVAKGFSTFLLPQFDVAAVAALLSTDQLTSCFFVPTMISMLLQRDDILHGTYDRLRTIMYGASPMSPTLLRKAMATFGCDFINLFGAGTEAGLQAYLPAEDHRRALAGAEHLLGSIGKAPTGVALRLTDGAMNDVAQGEVGEITTRSDMVMDGYLEMPEKTAESLRDGWFRAGDLAHQDADGYLYLDGRKNDMIIRGGENIYPVEIETVLERHPAVALVSVVGVPDEHWGETVRAWIMLRPDVPATPEELMAFCREHLASYKTPTDVRIVEELPMNPSGKILKRELRAMT